MTSDPKTKEQFLNRILSYDFDGNFGSLGEGRITVSRIAPNKIAIRFPATGQYYELVVRKPRVQESSRPRRVPPLVSRKPAAKRQTVRKPVRASQLRA